jgi:hypothetical protein
MTREEELAREGWSKRGTYDEPRLSEIVETYREAGFEVRVEPFLADEEPGCAECMRAEPEKFKTVYTRRKTAAP